MRQTAGRESPELLSTAQVAELLRVNVATVNRWAASGRLPVAVQFPGIKGARMFARTDVERLATQGAA